MTILYMVGKDETGRYLEACLSRIHDQGFRTFFWDDRSTDGTPDLAAQWGATVSIRPSGFCPSFSEAEGAFRQAGWEAMTRAMHPEPGEWVFTLDTDEFLLGDIDQAVEDAEECGYGALRFQIPEVFLLNPIAVRVDGFWGNIDGFRACRYEEGDQSFRKMGMGCGTLPAYAVEAWSTKKAQILHTGYANMDDRRDKFVRYTSEKNNGHASKHVLSIMSNPELVLWDGETPNIWRGIREITSTSVRR